MSKYPTIRRAKWHGSFMWQATDSNGQAVAYRIKPTPGFWFNGYWGIDGRPADCTYGPKRKLPRDYTTTLRRIRAGERGGR